MGKLGTAVLAAAMVMGAVLAWAGDRDCIDPKNLIGTWKGYLVSDLLAEEGEASGVEMDIQSSGTFLAMAYGQNPPYVFEIEMAGDWRLDCATLVSRTKDIARLDVFVDEDLNLSEEEASSAEHRIPEMSEAIKKGILDNPDFRRERKETVIYVDGRYLITQDENQKLYLFGKKK